MTNVASETGRSSGVFGVLLIALIQGINGSEAEQRYFRARPLEQEWDQRKVQKLGTTQLQQVLPR